MCHPICRFDENEIAPSLAGVRGGKSQNKAAAARVYSRIMPLFPEERGKGRMTVLIVTRQWKKAQAIYGCTTDVCPCWPVNQLYTTQPKNDPTYAFFHCLIVTEL